jgi:hypothetical protein
MPNKKAPEYYLSITDKEKKTTVHAFVKEQDGCLYFKSLDGKSDYSVTKRDLMLHLQTSKNYDIGKDCNLLLPPVKQPVAS